MTREELQFWAVWELERVTPQRWKQIETQRDRHTIIVVEQPLSEQYKRNHGYSAAFFVYLDGFEAIYYARNGGMSDIKGVRRSLFAPGEHESLLAMITARLLFPNTCKYWDPLPLQREIVAEEESTGLLSVSVPDPGRTYPLQAVPHPYCLHTTHYEVLLGNKKARVTQTHYTADELRVNEHVWFGMVDNYCFLPFGEQPVEVYGRPGKLLQPSSANGMIPE